jgi:hypothetical protein
MLFSQAMKTAGAAGLIVLVAACGKPPHVGPADSVPAAPPACEILPAPPIASDTVTVVLFEPVAPEFAPWGHNAAEVRVFRHLYETLISADCDGRVDRCLAGSWRKEDGGFRWEFELRGGARFWDGAPVLAVDVLQSWADALMLDTGIDSVKARGDRAVAVYLREPHRDVPLILSAPAFSVARRTEGAAWPLGSGPYEIGSPETVVEQSAGGALTLVPVSGGEKPVIRFVEASARDARDLLEGPVDLMITEDPTVIEYASANPVFVAAPLPWEKTYVILSPGRVREVLDGRVPGTLPQDFLAVLARDAVRCAARGYQAPSWWGDLEGCKAVSGGDDARGGSANHGSSSNPRRILYDADDPTARDLAARIVALGAADPARSPDAEAIASAVPGIVGASPGVVAQGVDERELDRSLRSGDEAAYIVSIPLRPAIPCDEIGRLLDRVPWIAGLGPSFSRAIVPLVDTRPTAIARRDKFGMISDWYGSVIIAGQAEKGD